MGEMLGNEENHPKKSSGLLCQRNDMKYSFIAHHKKTWPVDLMCRRLGVQRNVFYIFSKRRDIDDWQHQELLESVKDIAQASNNSYGSRRMKKALNVLDYPIVRYKSRKLMKDTCIQVRYRKKYKVTTTSQHKRPVFENILFCQFDVATT